MAIITIKHGEDSAIPMNCYRGIGKVEQVYWDLDLNSTVIIIPRMSSTRFNNVVKRVLEKNLTEQGITPISIKYSE